jgi:hypothetical protein
MNISESVEFNNTTDIIYFCLSKWSMCDEQFISGNSDTNCLRNFQLCLNGEHVSSEFRNCELCVLHTQMKVYDSRHIPLRSTIL